MPSRYQQLPSLSQREHLSGYLAAGPAAADADTSQAFASVERASTVLEVFVFPSADVAQDAADATTITLQNGATVVATADNSAGAITAAAGIELTITAANANVSAGDVLSLKVDNDGAGAQDVSSTGFAVHVVARPNL